MLIDEIALNNTSYVIIMYHTTIDGYSNRDQLQQNQSKAIGHCNITSSNNNHQTNQATTTNQVQSQSNEQQHDHMQTLADIEAIISLEESKYQEEQEQGQQQQIEYYNYTTTSTTSGATNTITESKSIDQQYQYTGLDSSPNQINPPKAVINNNNTTNTDTYRQDPSPPNDSDTMDNGPEMQIEVNDKSTLLSKNPNARPYVKIIEQPARCSLRFRYECEGRSAGSLPGVNSSADCKTYPTIQIMNYVGKAVVVVSCVTKDVPFKPHPHNLVGKEGCKKGICTIVMNNNPDMICSFGSLGIQCVKKKDIEESLRLRETIQVDPFRTGFAHKQHVSNIDLNVIRLCFQVFVDGPDHAGCTIPLTPIVSEPIHDKKAMSDLVITKLSHCSAPATGGREVILLCDRISKDDIQIRFYEERNGKLLWEKYSEFQPNDVHKQVAICFKTPKYYNENIQHPVMVRVQLKRPSDNQVSEPRLFQFLPCENDEDIVARKRQKIDRIDLNNYVKENILQPQQQHHHHHQQQRQQQQQQTEYPHNTQQHQVSQHLPHIQQRLITYQQQQQQQQHLTVQTSLIGTQGQLSMVPQQANISPVDGVSEPQQIYMSAVHNEYQKQISGNPQMVSERTTPSPSPNPFSVFKPSNTSPHKVYNLHQQQRLQQEDNSSRQNTPSPGSSVHQIRHRIQVTNNDPISITPYDTNVNNYYACDLQPSEVATTNSQTPISRPQHSPSNNVRNTERQNNFMNIIENAIDHRHHNRHNQNPNRYQQQQNPITGRVVVKHEIIDDEGKIMQIVDRNPQQTSPDQSDGVRQQQATGNQTPDTNALSTRLDSLGLDGIDTTLMKEIGFNSALMLNLDSNLSLNLTNSSHLAIGSSANSNMAGNNSVALATASDNGQIQPNHTLNTPQVSELDARPVGEDKQQ